MLIRDFKLGERKKKDKKETSTSREYYQQERLRKLNTSLNFFKMTTITSAVSNFMNRRSAELVETEEPEDIDAEALNRGASDNNSIVDEDGEEGLFIGRTLAAESRTVSAGNDESESSQRVPILEPEGDANRNNSTASNRIQNSVDATSGASPEIELASDAESASPTTTRTPSRRRAFRGLTLRDLEEERDIVQRRTGGCVLLSSFVLLRLWVQALVTGDFGLLLLCLVFTSWTAKFIRYTRDREEELNRMINDWDESAEDEPSMNDARLSRMSFQSQLALAIMQSQIQMMEGGYGHPDGGENRPGVGQDSRKNWDMFEFNSASSLTQRGNYGSNGDSGKTFDDDEPTCSICLCEYEKGDKLIMLPCKHVFHEDCINSWTENNTRCPLCNADLTSIMSSDEVV